MKYTYAEVVKLVDTHVSGACGASCAGSSPAFGTNSQASGDAKHRVRYWFPPIFLFSTAVPPTEGRSPLCQVIQRDGIILKIRKLI